MIDLDTLSTAELAQLVASASAELNRRMSSPVEVDVPPADLPKISFVHTPPESDQEFVAEIRAIIREAGYVKAEERRRVARLATEYPAWMKRQGIPLSAGTGEWRKLAENIRRRQRNKR